MGFQQTGNQLEAFIDEKSWNAEALETLIGSSPHTYTFSWTYPQNWNEEWEKSFTPVCVDDFCRVRAKFHAPDAGVRHEIIITPKMSFGTGHHATTYLMIKVMSELDLTGKRVLDFGTGTGILAILAERMGAADVQATDLDPWSIENAKENLQENNCSRVALHLSDGLGGVQGPFDVILANINRNVLIQQMGQMAELTRKGGILILSGFLTNDLSELEKAFYSFKLLVVNYLAENSWAVLLVRKS